MCFFLQDLNNPALSVNLRTLANSASDFKRSDRLALVVNYSGYATAVVQGGFAGDGNTRKVEPLTYVCNWKASAEQTKLVRRIAIASRYRADAGQDPSFFLSDSYLPWEELDMTQRRASVAGTAIRTEAGAIYYYPKIKGVFTTLETDKVHSNQWLITMAIQETELLTP
jgi:hypothetical protein